MTPLIEKIEALLKAEDEFETDTSRYRDQLRTLLAGYPSIVVDVVHEV